jgi:hypothetical protein
MSSGSDLIQQLRKLITEHFTDLNQILVNQNTDLDIEAELNKFDFNNFIIKNKFKKDDNSTYMEKEAFYKKIIDNLGLTAENTVFYLTNGVNKKLEIGWGGTNNAITNINPNFITNLNKDHCILPTGFYIKSTLLNDVQQQIEDTGKDLLPDCIYPGSTYYVDIKDFKLKGVYNIEGVYHINGWDHNKSKDVEDVEDKMEYIHLVSVYYKAILDHFFNNIIDNTNKMSILHLVQCPGHEFKGTDKTTVIFINTVYGYLFENREKLKDLQFRISIDYELNKIFCISDYNIYNDIKNVIV